MFIYQIGDTVIRGFASHSSPVSFRGEASQSDYSSLVTFSNNYTLPDITELTISGVISCLNDRGQITPLINLMKIAGKPYIDIIGYLPNTCCCVGLPCSVCGGQQPDNGVYWWHTYGMVTKVSRDFTLDPSYDEQLVTIPVTINVKINPMWQPLNPYLWFAYHGKDVIDPFTMEPDYPNNLSDEVEDEANRESVLVAGMERYFHPETVVPFHYEPEFVFVKKRLLNQYLLYSGNYWNDWDTTDIRIFGRQPASGLTAYQTDPSFNAICRTMHCFNNLQISGSLTITVENEITPYNIVTSVSTIDLAELYNTLNTIEYGNITSDYTLYCATDDLASSFVMIGSSSTLEPVRSIYTGNLLIPNWQYEHRCPGELIGARNKVTITKHASTGYGCLHLYRMV